MYTVNLELKKKTRVVVAHRQLSLVNFAGEKISPATTSTSASFESRRYGRSGVSTEEPKLRDADQTVQRPGAFYGHSNILESGEGGNRQAESAALLGLIGKPACRTETTG